MSDSLTDLEEKELHHNIKISFDLEQEVSCNRLKWFTPTGAQEQAISEIAKDNFITIFSAANGTGKTTLMVNILGACVFGDCDNPYFDFPFFKNYPFIKSARIVSTPKEIEEIGSIQKEIKKWWPKDKYTASKNGKHFNSQFISGDWIVDVMTYEQDVSQFEGANLSLIIFNEPPPINILYASIARLRRGGKILIFMTPLDNGGEIIEDLLERNSVILDGEEVGKVGIVYADIESACIEHGVRGYLKHKDIVQMLNFYDPEEVSARAQGRPTHLTGRIYPSFELKAPFIVDDFVIPENWARVHIVDPHDGIPFAQTWAAVNPDGHVFIYDERPTEDLEKITSTNLTIPDYSRIIREAEGRDKIYMRLIDPYFANQRYSNTGKTIKQELSELGFDFVDGDTSGLDLGHKRVREFLRYQSDKPVSIINQPKLHIMRKCRNHWRSMLRYKRKILKSGEVKDKIILDETYKHFCDNIRHLLMRNDLQYFPQMMDAKSGVSYRVVGDMGDIHFDDDDDTEANYNRYHKLTHPLAHQ